MFSLQTGCVVKHPDAGNQEVGVSGSADRIVISGRLKTKGLYSVLINTDKSISHTFYCTAIQIIL